MQNISLIPINQITDFSFDIFCRLSTSFGPQTSSLEILIKGKNQKTSYGLTGCVDRIKKYGILNPVWICGKTLIAGFEQFSTAREAELTEIPAFVLPDDTSKEKQLDLCLELIGAKKMLTLMSMARLAVLTGEIVDEPVKWLRERHNQHFWSITIDVFDRLKSLAISPSSVCNYFQKYDAPLSAAMSVVNLESIFQDKIIKWANENRVRPIELERIITDITDCAKVEKIECERIREEIIGEISCEKKGGIIREFKKMLNERKNPLLTNLRKKKNAATKEFKKVTGIEISYDPDFENSEMEFKFKCKSEEEFKEIMRKGETRITRIFTDEKN